MLRRSYSESNNWEVIQMDYAYLGRTDLKVSRLTLDTMNFGELTDEAAV